MDKRILRFTASWCQPCKMLAKTLEDINTGIPIEVIDIDVNQEMAIDFGVRGVPTLIMMDGNNEVKRHVGMSTQQKLEEWLNND